MSTKQKRRFSLSTETNANCMYSLQPITQREAFAFILEHYRHHDDPEGWLFGLAVNDGERVVGVAVVGRPVARMLQNGFTAEVTRVCIVEDLEPVKDHEGAEHSARLLPQCFIQPRGEMRGRSDIEGC